MIGTPFQKIPATAMTWKRRCFNERGVQRIDMGALPRMWTGGNQDMESNKNGEIAHILQKMQADC